MLKTVPLRRLFFVVECFLFYAHIACLQLDVLYLLGVQKFSNEKSDHYMRHCASSIQHGSFVWAWAVKHLVNKVAETLSLDIEGKLNRLQFQP